MKLLKLTLKGSNQEVCLKLKDAFVEGDDREPVGGIDKYVKELRECEDPAERGKLMDRYFMLTNLLNKAVQLPDDFADEMLTHFSKGMWKGSRAELLPGYAGGHLED